MQQRDRRIAYGVRGHVVLVIETEGETLADEPVSSSRLRKAAPAAGSEFDQLRIWRENAVFRLRG
jgi:hypothetical protein